MDFTFTGDTSFSIPPSISLSLCLSLSLKSTEGMRLTRAKARQLSQESGDDSGSSQQDLVMSELPATPRKRGLKKEKPTLSPHVEEEPEQLQGQPPRKQQQQLQQARPEGLATKKLPGNKDEPKDESKNKSKDKEVQGVSAATKGEEAGEGEGEKKKKKKSKKSKKHSQGEEQGGSMKPGTYVNIRDTVAGKPKSGRVWKAKERRSVMRVAVKELHQSWKEREHQRKARSIMKGFEKEVQDAKKAAQEEEKKRAIERKKRKQENEKKSEVFQVIKNTRKIKLMSRKQRRMLAKRDITQVI